MPEFHNVVVPSDVIGLHVAVSMSCSLDEIYAIRFRVIALQICKSALRPRWLTVQEIIWTHFYYIKQLTVLFPPNFLLTHHGPP